MSRLSAIANPPARRLAELLARRHRDEAYRPIRPDSAAITRAVHRKAAHDPNSVFVEHFAAATGRLILDADGESYGGIFSPFTRSGTPIFGVGNAPLPTAMCDWLGRRALPRSISTTPATRSMLATLGDNGPIDINPPDGGIEQFWQYAKSVIVDLNIAKSALPDTLLRALAGSTAPHSNRAAFPNLTMFTQRFVDEGALGKLPRDFGLDEDRLATAIECYLIGLENEGLRTLLGPEVTSWLEEPLDNAADFSPLELILLIVAGSKPSQNELQANDLTILRSAISWLAPDRATNAQPTLRILGLHSSSSGLGTNMRMSERACAEIGLPVELVDTQLDQIMPARISEGSPIALSRPVDLFHLNLDEVPGVVCRYTQQDRRETYRIGFALWETSAMPEQHRAGMQLVDEIWAPTAYVADVYRAAGHPNVHVIGKGIELPEPRPFDLSSLGIPTGLTVFLAAFDMGSWIDRKNPIAAVQGFQRAFPRDPDVRLIIKSNGLIQHPGDRTNQAARLEAAAEADPRIILMSELLPFQSYLGLIQAVSATVSPHRAEGFGYFPAYSLLLGVPTIVTDHSGTKDFCTEETSFPVRASMRILRQGEFVYDAPNASWADIDVNHLAERMRGVRDNPKEAGRRAHRGREILERRYSMSEMAARYLERLSQI